MTCGARGSRARGATREPRVATALQAAQVPWVRHASGGRGVGWGKAPESRTVRGREPCCLWTNAFGWATKELNRLIPMVYNGGAAKGAGLYCLF